MTEKDYNPEQKHVKAAKKQKAVAKVNETTKVEKENKKTTKSPQETKPTDEEKKDVKETKPVKKEIVKPKKTEAYVNALNVPVSTKYSMAICKFIMNKKIEDAIKDLEQVLVFKKAVPMKGEIPHRKGKGMMSGRFPQKAAKNFIVLLKSLSGNATYNGIEEPVIVEAVANIGARPYGRFGRVRKKRTHVRIVAKESTKKSKKEKK